MFTASLLDVSWGDRSRRGYANLMAFTMEALAVGVFIAAPLLYVQGLPHVQMAVLSLPVPPAAALPPAERPRAVRSASNLTPDGRVITPLEIPEHPAQIDDESMTPPVDMNQLGVRDGTGDPRVKNPIISWMGPGLPNVAPPPAVVAPKPVQVSHLMDGYLIYRVQPEYPAMARLAHIQGSVVLHALIGRDGRIEQLQVVSGQAMLVQSAINAVSQWRYRPYVLNNEPVEVETQITVNFTLAGG